MVRFCTLMVAIVAVAWSGDAWAGITAALQKTATVSADDGSIRVAKKRKRKKKRKKKRKTPAPTATKVDGEAATDDDGADGSGEVKAEAEPKPEPESQYRKADGVGGAFVLVGPVYSGIYRKLNFGPRGGTSDNLRSYRVDYASLVGGRLEFYPGVLLEVPYLDKIGLRGSFRMAVALKSAARLDPDLEYTTHWSELDVDLTGRFSFGDFLVIASAGFGTLAFELDVPASDPLAGEVHSLNYQFIRVGFDLRYAFGKLSILAGGGFRYALGTGELSDTTFPDSSAIGFDGNVGVAYRLLSFTELFLLFQYTQFVHTLQANATYVAESASDVYLGGQAGVTLFF